MNGGFVPPMPQMPAQVAGSGFGSAPNQINQPASTEQQGQWAKSVARSANIRQATGTVIKTRSQFKAYLKQNGMNLVTSAVEFQATGDFIASSYVEYINYDNMSEPLGQFLSRYPQLQQAAIEIRDRLRPVQGQMQVITPTLSGLRY